MSLHGRKLAVAAALGLLALGLAACGGSGETSSGSTAADTESTETVSHPQSSGPPLNVALAIHATLQGGRAPTEYAEDSAILISSVIERGGSFRISMFRGSGFSAGATELDPAGSPQKRYREVQKTTRIVLPYIDQTLGQMPLDGPDGKRLTSLPEGEAVGEALREAVKAVRGKPGERWAVVAGDGFDDTGGELPLPNVPQTARILREAVGNVNAGGVGIAMVGVGLDPRHTHWNQDGPLTKAWARVCHEIHARECQIHADPRLPPPLEGTAEALLGGVS